MIDKLMRATKLARRRSRPPADCRPASFVSRTLEEAAREARELGLERLVICGDGPFRRAAEAQLGDVEHRWTSFDFRDVQSGAARLVDLDLADFDGVVVGGEGVKNAYVGLLYALAERGVELPVLWVGEDFELCLGSLPIASQVERADVHLFHHFAEYFLVKDPVLARFELLDGERRTVLWKLVKPNETVTFHLDDWRKGRDRTTSVNVLLTHPVLSRGRHLRWRFWADLYWKGSITSVHGLHDHGPGRSNEFRISASRLGRGTATTTLPNYTLVEGEHGLEAIRVRGSDRLPIQRSPEKLVEQADVTLSPGDARPGDVIGWQFDGFGGSMWYAFEDERRAGPGANLSSNHMVSCPIASVGEQPCPEPLGARRQALRDRDIVVNPHSVPVLEPGEPLCFGFSFESGNPAMTRLRLLLFERAGEHLDTVPLHVQQPGPLYTNEFLREHAPAVADRVRLVLVAPDWEERDMHPSPRGTFCELFVKHVDTQDYDVTELQNSWRNLGVMVPELPHWLHPALQVTGRTNLSGRALPTQAGRTGLLITNASGWLGYRTEAVATVKLYDHAGGLTVGSLTVPAFTSGFRWLDELFPDLDRHLRGRAGWVLVQSPDADMTGQIVTVHEDRAVSLQHLWGY